MEHTDESDYRKYVMNQFNCNESMAQLVINSYKVNGNYESMLAIYQQEQKTKQTRR